MDNRVEAIYNIITDRGYRLTEGRMQLVKFFLNEKEHLRVKDIYDHLRDQNVSLASIYRNIEMLEKADIVNRIVIHNEAYYELKLFSHKRVHLHFRCTICGSLKEYTDSELVKLVFDQKEYINREYGDKVSKFSIVYEGVCSNCIGGNNVKE